MGVEDDGGSVTASREQRGDQSFEVVSVDDIESPLPHDLPQLEDEQRVEQQQFLVRRARRLAPIGRYAGDAVNGKVGVRDRVAQVVGDDVDLVTAAAQRPGQPADAHRRAARARERTRRHHGDPKAVCHRSPRTDEIREWLLFLRGSIESSLVRLSSLH